MYGLEAIQQGNGWVMAGLGATIVLTGLAVLSFLVSRIRHIVGMLEIKEKDVPVAPPEEPAESPRIAAPEQMPDDIGAAFLLCQDLTQELGEAFCLEDFHRHCKQIGISDPHFMANNFRDAGLLVPAGECLFSWKTPSA